MNNDRKNKLLGVARAVSEFSKDSSTKVGALIVGKGGEFVASGWNGAPRGSSADVHGDPRGERPEKYFWFSHAESNAIVNAARVGTPLAGSTIVVTHFPCMDCARSIVQAGIVKVVVPVIPDDFYARWKESIDRSVALFQECGVTVEYASS